MAVGDTAAAAGAPVVPQTDDARNGWSWINKLADWVASRYPLPLPIDKGGTGATTAATAREKLGIDRIQAGEQALRIDDTGRVWAPGIRARDYTGNKRTGSDDGDNRLAVVTPNGTLGVLQGTLDDSYFPDDLNIRDDVTAAGSITARTNLYADGAKNTVDSIGALHINSDGRVGRAQSARKYKHGIREAGLDIDALLAIEPKRFRLNTVGDDAPEQLGFIADDFEDAGLSELVIHNEDGGVEGLHYERVTVALYAIVRAQQQMLDGHARVLRDSTPPPAEGSTDALRGVYERLAALEERAPAGLAAVPDLEPLREQLTAAAAAHEDLEDRFSQLAGWATGAHRRIKALEGRA